jgi:hypothetical protein
VDNYNKRKVEEVMNKKLEELDKRKQTLRFIDQQIIDFLNKPENAQNDLLKKMA